MDRITKSLLDEFIVQNSLGKLPEETGFEHFCGYLVTSGHFTESISTDDIHVGAGNDCGIDCAAIIVNGALITEPEEIEDLVETNGYLDATFIFTQSERSSSFETAKVGQFSFGVADFFSVTPSLKQNESIKTKFRISNEIFKRSSKFKKGNPQCFLYYCTTGKWVEDQNLVARAKAVVGDLENLTLFRKVDFEYVGAEQIQKLFRATKNAIVTEINFPNRTVLPELPGIEQSFLGLLSSKEYLKMIENGNGEVITSIFYDNVRHWQEWNSVNKEISSTLENDLQKVYFPLLNNGVTIIAKKLVPTGNKCVVEDYQIVNGCQTSFVLFENREKLGDDVLIPVRLIATEDADIRNSIIKATNRQTPVTEEQLFALSDFPRKLEDYFTTFDGAKRLYYERRSRQYNAEEKVEKVRIVNMTTMVRAFAATFLGVPHRTTRSYRALLNTVGNDIFNKEHKLEMYYVAAYAYYKLEYLFRSQVISSQLKPARYHLLYLFILENCPTPLPRSNSHEMGRLCETLMQLLWDDNRLRQMFTDYEGKIRLTAGGRLDGDSIRTEAFTDQIRNGYVANRNKRPENK